MMANELLTVEHLQKFAENISPYLGVNSNIYSLEEKQIGSWVDGKPVYQKTIYIPTVTLTSQSSYYKYEYDLTDLDIDINISMEGSFYDSLNNARYLFTLNSPNRNNELYCRFEDKRLFIFSLSNYSYAGSRLRDVYITIRYTKISEVVGSMYRYLKLSSNGSTENPSNHYVEVQAFDDNGVNVALGKTSNVATDGVYNDSGAYIDLGVGNKTLTIDLGGIYKLDYIRVWHYYGDGRTYHNVVVSASVDGVDYDVLFNSNVDGEYAETPNGKTIYIN